eukprot:3447565-Prymnesium_polylepis.1
MSSAPHSARRSTGSIAPARPACSTAPTGRLGRGRGTRMGAHCAHARLRERARGWARRRCGGERQNAAERGGVQRRTSSSSRQQTAVFAAQPRQPSKSNAQLQQQQPLTTMSSLSSIESGRIRCLATVDETFTTA